MTDLMERPTEEESSELIETPKQEEAAAPVAKIKPRTKPLNKKEEATLYNLHCTSQLAERLILLEAFEGAAHKIAGFGSFEDYCQERLGLSYNKAYLSTLVKAAKFERQVTGKSFNSLKLLSEAPDPAEVRYGPVLRVAMEVSRLPEEKWNAVYEEIKAGEGQQSPSEVAANAKRIVGREIRLLDPEAPRPGRKPGSGKKATPIEAEIVTKTPKNNMSPIVPPTYDGSGEQQRIEAEQEAAANGHEWNDGSGANSPKEVIQGVRDEIIQLRSFVKTFVDIIENDPGNVARMNELYNDCTQYQAERGL